MSGFEIERAGAEAIEELEPLWNALREHHGPQTPMFGEVRDREGSWRKRRPHYEQLLAKPGSFALIARRDGRAVGYAMVELDHDTLEFLDHDVIDRGPSPGATRSLGVLRQELGR